jgi:biopolymer transport protein ExbD
MQISEKKRVIAEINLVPLIDVSLILVIIFMVITPMIVQSQLSVKLPKAGSGTPADSSATVTVSIAKSGGLSVEGRVLRWDELEHELSLRLSRSAQKTVLVQADKSVPVERVVFVLDTARKLGVGKLGIGVEQTAEKQ